MKLQAGALPSTWPEPSKVLKRRTRRLLTLSSLVGRCIVGLSLLTVLDAKALKDNTLGAELLLPTAAIPSGTELLLPTAAVPSGPVVDATTNQLSSIKRIAALMSAGHAGSPSLTQSAVVAPRSWNLRLCNAYPYEGWVHVYHTVGRRGGMSYTTSGESDEEWLTKETGPLPFKRCTDISKVPLQRGSLLKFRISGGMHIGTFFVERLPLHGSILQLVLKRRDTWSTAADFSSHIFPEMSSPQIALVDAYLGSTESVLEVRDVPTGIEHMQEAKVRQQEVHFGTVVDIVPGSYEWRLMDSHVARRYAEKASVEFFAVGSQTYTVLRVGAKALGGQSYSEELIVWPADGAVVHTGPDSGNNQKGLFGIPTDLRRSRRSSATPQLLNAASLAFAALIATITAWM